MLRELLALLDRGEAYSQADLARLLNTNEETVLAQIHYLESQGFLKKVTLASGGGCASGSCKGCPGGCGQEISPAATANMPVFWERNKE